MISSLENSCIVIACLTVAIAFGDAAATESGSTNPELLMPAKRGYCGVNSVYTCLRSLGLNLKPSDLIRKKYVGTTLGSTASELVKAARDFGADAHFVENLGYLELQAAQSPMILHVRSPGGENEYSHWVAFLGFESGDAIVVDAPETKHIPLAEVLATWDGSAIIVSDTTAQLPYIYTSHLNVVFLGAVAFFSIGILRTSIDRLLGSDHSLSGTVVLLTVALGLAVIFHAFSSVGFLRNPEAVTALQPTPPAFASITLDVFAESLSDYLLIDARLARDFANGSLPDARNIPVDSPVQVRAKALRGVSRSQPIVVFCQSAGCGYSDQIAHFLEINGYSDVSVYREGYVEWRGRFDD